MDPVGFEPKAHPAVYRPVLTALSNSLEYGSCPQDLDCVNLLEPEQILIAGDQTIRLRGDGGRNERRVRGVSDASCPSLDAFAIIASWD